VLCATAGAKGVKVFGSANKCGVALLIEERFRATTLNNHLRTPVLVSLNFQYYTSKIKKNNK
jgi:hypothetical protein